MLLEHDTDLLFSCAIDPDFDDDGAVLFFSERIRCEGVLQPIPLVRLAYQNFTSAEPISREESEKRKKERAEKAKMRLQQEVEHERQQAAAKKFAVKLASQNGLLAEWKAMYDAGYFDSSLAPRFEWGAHRVAAGDHFRSFAASKGLSGDEVEKICRLNHI